MAVDAFVKEILRAFQVHDGGIDLLDQARDLVPFEDIFVTPE
jgi:hypothetical protein